MSSLDLSECTKQLSEHAYALSAEAETLTRLSKEDSAISQHPIVLLLTRKSVEVCHLAHIVQQIVRERSGQDMRPSRGLSGAWKWMRRENDTRIVSDRKQVLRTEATEGDRDVGGRPDYP